MIKWLKSITKQQAGDFFGWIMFTGLLWVPFLVFLYSFFNLEPFWWGRIPMLAFVCWMGLLAVGIKISAGIAINRTYAPNYDKVISNHWKEQQKPAYTWLWRD